MKRAATGKNLRSLEPGAHQPDRYGRSGRLDEPWLGLAPKLAQEIFATVRDINAQGVTVLLVEQNVKQALRLAHRAYVLENGRLILQGKASDLAQNEHIHKAYLGI